MIQTKAEVLQVVILIIDQIILFSKHTKHLEQVNIYIWNCSTKFKFCKFKINPVNFTNHFNLYVYASKYGTVW